MQRTYGRRALRRRSGVQSRFVDHREADPLINDPSPPRKRQQVYVEIVSPKRKKACFGKHPHNPPPASSDTERLNITDLKPSPKPVTEGMSGSPKTPERSQKDYSSLFATPSHHPRPGSQSKQGSIIKRMLGRSRTESSLEATPSVGIPSVITPMARQASLHSLPTTFPGRENTPEASSQSSPQHLPARNIRTYAGSSRSFLVALPVPDADPLSTVEDDTEPHESYADLRTRWGIDLSEDDPQPCPDTHVAVPTPLKPNASEPLQPSLSTGMMNDLKSITELRSKGESRRFLDEVGYLFEGLDASSAVGLRRASAFEIVSKLCDLDFNRRAKTSDFYIRTWDKLSTARGGTSDKIFDATITFFAALAARDPRTLTEVARHEEFIPTLVEVLSSLGHSKDVLAVALTNSSDDYLRSHGILGTEITAVSFVLKLKSHTELSMLEQLRSLAKLVSKESQLSSVNQPSTRFFISHSLATLHPSLLSGRCLPTLLVNLRAELSLLEPRITAYESGLPLLPSTGVERSDIPSFYHIEACLRLLDSYLLGHWPSSSGLSHVTGFTSELISLCIASSSLSEGGEEEMVIAGRCLCSAMRVLTLLSHDDPWWCAAALEVSDALPFFAIIVMRSQARWMELRNTEFQKNSVEAFDRLCLALGLVMNWASLSPKAAVLARIKLINPVCSRSRLCVRTCQCPGQESVLESFTALHAQYSDNHQDHSPECAFLRGYTAILLGLLMKNDVSNQPIVMSTLPGASPSHRIKSLITHCYSFLDLYDDTMVLPSSDSPHAPSNVDACDALDYQRATLDKKGGQIAQSVIVFLESLCDI